MRRLVLTLVGLGAVAALAAPHLADARKPKPKPPREAPRATPERPRETPRPTEIPRPADTSTGGVTTTACTDVPAGMVCVTGGTFTMGSHFGDADELPTHKVHLNAFAIDKYEVSFAEYMQCVQAQKCGMPRYYPPLKTRKIIKSRTRTIKRRPPRRRGARPAPRAAAAIKIKVNTILVDPSLPAAGITWKDAQSYCAYKGKHLPTEAQWEYAARGPKSNYYAWGGAKPTCERVNSSKCGGLPKPTKSLPAGASPFGAHHLTGNAWEWVHDFYDAKYYSVAAGATDPMGPANVQDPLTSEWKYQYRVIRGGSWSGIPGELRTAYRYRLLPDMYANDIGFRCAKSPTPPVSRRRPVRLRSFRTLSWLLRPTR